MRHARTVFTTLVTTGLLTACAGTPVPLGTRTSDAVVAGRATPITAEACGFQLLLFIPIRINDRQARAYNALKAQAPGATITDVRIKESWSYGFVGTSYCTQLLATAVEQ
jgi:hypothetical protein